MHVFTTVYDHKILCRGKHLSIIFATMLQTAVMKSWIMPIAAVLIILLTVPKMVASSSGLVLTSACENALNSLLLTVDLTECPNILSSFTNPIDFANCTYNKKNVDCFDPYDIIGYVDMQRAASPIVSPYNLTDENFPSGAPLCSLCYKYQDNLDKKSSCHKIFEVIRANVLQSAGDALSLAADSITIINYANFKTASDVVTQSCSPTSYSNPMDAIKISFLGDQSQIRCSAELSYGYEVSKHSALIGGFDMRSTLQCGTCAMIPCLPGQLCQNGSPTITCPEGYYCPSTKAKVVCPSGHFCPSGSIKPKKCRDIAGGSCDEEGATREVVWVPLFVAILIFVVVIVCLYLESKLVQLRWLLEARGLPNNNIGYSNADDESNLINSKSDSSSKSTYNKLTNANEDHILNVSVEFIDVTMITGATRRLDNVSGIIEANKFTAIFGGSGAGKTSLMNALLSREAITSGDIRFNFAGNRRHLSEISHSVGFVPQVDVLIRSMTVYQALWHSAKSRLPPSYSEEEVMEIVESVLDQLDLVDKRHVVIGGAEDSDIRSGGLGPGDRKKVNIGVELVARPRVLFLDEPTTNIDASSAFKIVKIIRNLSHSNKVTVVAVVHQPRGEIFNYIDNMLLMVPGGRVGYNGPIDHALPWFKSIGFKPVDLRDNKTDFFLDVTCSANLDKFRLSASSDGNPITVGDRASSDFSGLWTNRGHTFLTSSSSSSLNDKGVSISDTCDSNDKDQQQNSNTLDRSGAITTTATSSVAHLTSRPKQSWLYLVYLHFYRGCLQRIKSNNLVINLAVYLVAGFILGIVTSGGPILTASVPPTYRRSCPPGAEMVCYLWQRFEIGPASFLLSMVLGSITIPAAVNTFGRERDVLHREAFVGVDPTSYFVGKLISDIPFICLSIFMYVCPILAIAPWTVPFGLFYVIYLALALFITSFGYFLSFVISNSNDATLAGAIISIMFNLFGGFVPKLGDGIMGVISYTHYASKALATAELVHGMGLTEEQYNSYVPISWETPSLSFDVGVVLIMTVIMYLLAFVVFKRSLRFIAL